jgi:hypothetical protein
LQPRNAEEEGDCYNRAGINNVLYINEGIVALLVVLENNWGYWKSDVMAKRDKTENTEKQKYRS